MLFRRILTAAAALFLPAAVIAQDDPFDPPDAKPVKVSLVAEQNAIVPGKPFTVGVRMEHTKPWHTYWRNPGDPGLPTTITWKLPPGFTAADSIWSIPHLKITPEGPQHLMEGTAFILTDITPPASLKIGENVDLEAEVAWLQCTENGCEPRDASLKLSLAVADNAEKDAALSAAFDTVRRAQPVPNPAWKVSVTPKGASWVVRAEPGEGANADPGQIYFFDAATAISYDAQQWRKDSTALVLEIGKKKEDSTTIPWGFLHASKSWVNGGNVLLIPVGTAPAPGAVPAITAEPATVVSTVNIDELIKTIRGWGVRTLSGDAIDVLTWPLALLLGFIGGMILNLMPCVFPVLGIKILGFVHQSGKDAAAVRKHGMVYAAGVILSVWILAGILLAIRKYGEQVGWGFQLQNPFFLTFLIILLFALSLNLAGVFEFGTSLTSVGSELQSESGYKGSFFSGILTVLVATPCTGPFMGPALGFALSATTPAALVVAVFTALALGLALPYVVLSYFPALVRKLPKPGKWMETFKQFMAFPMFATCGWLITVFARSTGSAGLTFMILALVLFAMALWLYGRFANIMAKPTSKHLALPLGVICVLGGSWMAWEGAQRKAPPVALGKDEVALSPQLIVDRRAKGLTTVVDFWATWCLQCETNKALAFSREEFAESLKKHNAIFMLADWSDRSKEIQKFLAAYDQGGIPFAIVIPPTGPVIQLPTVIASPDTAISGLKEAKKQSAL